MENKEYIMSISLNVLNHLGINLYSNLPSVLSEIVANAWDADASEVKVNIDKEAKTITIIDNGCGMSLRDINDKYLYVGYQKRNDPSYKENPLTPKYKRLPMGRKGIGKLSVFSIANTVEVYSVKGNDKNGFIMSADDIRNIFDGDKEKQLSYLPTPIAFEKIDLAQGTKIVLKDLKRNVRSLAFSRKRLARRFSVIGREYNFSVILNDVPISAQDRDYYDKIEFVWYLGDDSASYADRCKNATKKIKLDNQFYYDDKTTYSVKGWIGTFKEHGAGDEEDDTNKIILFARGKLIKEDLLPEFKEGRMFSKYLIGEIEADFMDIDEKDDIVTSDRQRILETDDRWEIFQDYFKTKVLNKIGNEWTEYRKEAAVSQAVSNIAIKTWFDSLKGDNRKYAKTLFQKIESLKTADEATKKELYKSSILAFERLALTQNLSKINSIAESQISTLLDLFSDIDDLEGANYYEITKGRLQVLEKFQSLTKPETKEKVLQEYLFEHLWLLHPSWDRATHDSHMEVSVNRIFKQEYIEKANLSPEEKSGRLDIKYRTTSGKHIIIELKKYDRKVPIDELLTQVRKYKNTLLKCLNQEFPGHSHSYEIICLLGTPPTGDEISVMNRQLLELNARFITYDELIEESLGSYKDYLARQKEISKVTTIINQI
ncbi:BbrUII/HgiDII family restriction enzyme [Alistipes indistinctus]|jgi:hypothetical protein|uniref:BbrUII/HgiDII family restriction enzyme n=1 Tax=Alistipes indistinctus TaxID=626932 RepID=UPI0026771927|nr:ATP-binding protein [Alistipes indistinctus]